MVTKVTRILIVALILALAIAVIFLNPSEITVFYGPSKSFSAMGGVVFLVCFALGVGVALVFWILYGVRAYFRERTLIAKGNQADAFYKQMLDARSHLATKQYARSGELWRKLIKRDPTDIIARIELSKSLEDAGELKEALKVLDKARTSDSSNVEVLIRAAEINIALDNKTAAIDNLALILYHQPNAYAASLARDLSIELNRVEDAIEYNKQFETLTGTRSDTASTALHYSQVLEEIKPLEPKEKAQRIKRFLNAHRNFEKAALTLADLNIELTGNIDKGIDVLLKTLRECLNPNSANLSGARVLWRRVVELYTTHHLDPKELLQAVKSAARNSGSVDDKKARQIRIDAVLDVARIELLAERPKEALSSLQEIEEAVKDLSCPAGKDKNSRSSKREKTLHALEDELRNVNRGIQFLALKARALFQSGSSEEAGEIWKKLSGGVADRETEKRLLEMSEKEHTNSNGAPKPPAPELSTP